MKIFISYRREDSQWPADRLYNAIRPMLSSNDEVFIDVDNIPLGVDFAAHLDAQVAQCDVLLALIGRDWFDARNGETGARRLDEPNDFVRLEIASALKRKVRVVPVLLDGAAIPSANALPDDLKPLALRNGVEVRRLSFDADAERLFQGLGLRAAAPAPKKRGVPAWVFGAAAVLVIGIGALLVLPDQFSQRAAPQADASVVEAPAPESVTPVAAPPPAVTPTPSMSRAAAVAPTPDIKPPAAATAVNVGASTADITRMAEQITRDLLQVNALVGAPAVRRVRVEGRPPYVNAEAPPTLNKPAMFEQLRGALDRSAQGRIRFVSAESDPRLGADYGLAAHIESLERSVSANGQMRRYYRFSLELIDLETGAVAWTGETYELSAT